jgi:hypothetical protein
MADRSYARAPGWRQMGARLVDMSMLAALTWPGRSRPLVRPGGPLSRLLSSSREVVSEQLRTPGQLLFGTRTVDRRTGSRVELWRSLVLSGLEVLAGELTRRLAVPVKPEQQREREDFFIEMQEIMRRYPQASPERDAARSELLARHPPAIVSSGSSLVRVLVPSLLVGLVNNRLRRRLAPTVEVLARCD